MKQVININFQGRVVPIEQTAYDILRNYIDRLSHYFAQEEGKEEIINDIENRIGELFQEKLKDGSSCITDSDVDGVINSMGRPEDIEAEEIGGGIGGNTASAEPTSNIFSETFTQSKRLFRNENDKVLGGVCSGLAHYFNVDTVIVRIIFVILMFTFGIGFIPYIILWVVVPSTATMQIGSVRKRLFRDTENKYVAGVCSGLANYFGIKTWIPRILFLLPLLSFASRWGHWGNWDSFSNVFRVGFSPTALIIYVILWLIIPEAKTTSEKLEMKGEKVDMNSIKASVMEEMKGVQSRAKAFGSEAAAYAKGKSADMVSDVHMASRRSGSRLGDVISLFFKIVLYAIGGVLLIGLLGGLLSLAVLSIGVFPLKDFVVNQGWQNAFAWGTLIFFIAAPVIGLITWIIRKITKTKTGGKYLTASFVGLWVIGWISVTCLVASVSKDFRRDSRWTEQAVYLANPGTARLEITTLDALHEFDNRRGFRLKAFMGLGEDTATVENVTVNLFKSSSDSFEVYTIKSSSGRTVDEANYNASLINFPVRQQGDLLRIDNGFSVNKTDKFRNQHVHLNIYVPVGKKIMINKNVRDWGGIYMDGVSIKNYNYNRDYINEKAISGWENGVEYTMTEKGLIDQDGLPIGEKALRDRQNNVDIGTSGIDIRGENGERVTINKNGIIINDGKEGKVNINLNLDSLKNIQQKKEEQEKDSLEKVIENAKEKLEKMRENNIPTAMYILPGYNPAWLM